MTPIGKSIFSSAGVLLAVAAVVGGTAAREKADLHTRTAGSNLYTGSLLADNSKQSTDVSPGDFFNLLVDLLKKHYVDPVNDEQKLATGAIKGMVQSLQNPDCVFMDPKQFKVFLNARNGKYEGIGVDLAYEIPSKSQLAMAEAAASGGPPAPEAPDALSSDVPLGGQIPALVVAAVVPGGPADKAGVKVGDSVSEIDGHWVVNPYELDAYSRLRAAYAAKKVTLEAVLAATRQLRAKIDSSTMPTRAKDRLITGTGESLRITWRRGNQLVSTEIAKGASTLPAVSKEPGGAIAVRFIPGAAASLKAMIRPGPITLDLRNDAVGDFQEMEKCLQLVAPAGRYGEILNLKGKAPVEIQTKEGSAGHLLTLLVDRSTRGPAEAFALALQTGHRAKLAGSDMSPDRNVIEVEKLPDGSGYTLVTGRYDPMPGKRSAA